MSLRAYPHGLYRRLEHAGTHTSCSSRGSRLRARRMSSFGVGLLGRGVNGPWCPPRTSPVYRHVFGHDCRCVCRCAWRYVYICHAPCTARTLGHSDLILGTSKRALMHCHHRWRRGRRESSMPAWKERVDSRIASGTHGPSH